MFDDVELGSEFFEGLTAIDQAIVAAVAAQPCTRCGGRLHRGDYPRKARGGLAAEAAEAFDRRFSLCCGREGCRRRATPPSVRFLGRRVYVGAVVIMASVVALARSHAENMRRRVGIAPRTARRWIRWWRDAFPATKVFVALAARVVPAIDRQRLPAAILDRLVGDEDVRMRRMLGWLAPLTTSSVSDGARFVRGLV
jgi:hypothetical protein